MEEELKRKYNDLLESYQKGTKYLEEKPGDEKAQNRLLELAQEMENIAKSIPGITEKEIQEGFDLQGAKSEENAPKEKQGAQMQVIAKTQNNSLQEFSSNWKMAEALAKSDIIPDNYKGKPQNVIIAIQVANQMDLPPFTVMQNLAIIKGKTAWSGSFCKTLIERTGKYKDLELNYVGEKGKDTYGCYLSAVRVADGKVINGPEVTMKMAKDEGWTSNKKWNTLTDLMLAYRCQSFFCRIYCPEAMNGIYTDSEIEDVSQNREQPKDIL